MCRLQRTDSGQVDKCYFRNLQVCELRRARSGFCEPRYRRDSPRSCRVVSAPRALVNRRSHRQSHRRAITLQHHLSGRRQPNPLGLTNIYSLLGVVAYQVLDINRRRWLGVRAVDSPHLTNRSRWPTICLVDDALRLQIPRKLCRILIMCCRGPQNRRD
jgi:hypothetical protein